MGFWSSLTVEVIGGIVTALLLGVGATWFAASQLVRTHDERVADLEEDNRRWFRDRDARVEVETRRATNERAASGQLYEGATQRALEHVKRQALHEYRDEMSAKRRSYREFCAAESWQHGLLRRRRDTPFPRFALTDEQRDMLASWRVYSTPRDAPGTTHPVTDDPTSEEREPDLRRFERDSDSCD